MNTNVKTDKILFGNLKEQDYVLKESLRVLRTNLQFCGDDVHTILLTSAMPGEGKSTVAMGLARSLVDSNKNVLLIDADMRKSVLVGRMGARRENGGAIYGLSHYLSGQKKMSEIVFTTEIPHFYTVFAGAPVPDPTELLGRQRFDVLVGFGKKYFDYVLIDSPPLGAAIDAVVAARVCDGAVLVTARGQTGKREIQGAKRQLEASGVPILGAVLNKIDRKNIHYRKYYDGYYSNS